jgi:mRNA interferase MazF
MVEMHSYPKRGDVYWITLDPSIGSETKKTRPCVIISNDGQNKKSSRIIIAPITSNVNKVYPFEAHVVVLGREGKTMLDQIRSVDKARLGDYITSFDIDTLIDIETALKIALALS